MVQFRMNRISVEQFAIIADSIPQMPITVDTDVSFGIVSNKHIVAVKFNLSFSNNSDKLLIMELHCHFEIHPENWAGFEKDKKVIIPKDLLAHFAMHTIGTARGVLFCKTEGTIFNQFIIPPINVAEKISEDIVIEL